MAAVARELVVVPAEQELATLEQFRADLRVAAGEDVLGEDLVSEEFGGELG
jgi:hypothetical protein